MSLPPRPERVARIGPAPFGQPGHRPLERVAVHVHRRGQGEIERHVRTRCLRADMSDSPVRRDADLHVRSPVSGDNRLFRVEDLHVLRSH